MVNSEWEGSGRAEQRGGAKKEDLERIETVLVFLLRNKIDWMVLNIHSVIFCSLAVKLQCICKFFIVFNFFSIRYICFQFFHSFVLVLQKILLELCSSLVFFFRGVIGR